MSAPDFSAMRRVIIIGSGGSGKSTLAKRLGEQLSLPVIHLDAHYWNPGWVETPPDAWAAKVDTLIKGEAWVMDGNYGGTMDARIARADTVIFLSFSVGGASGACFPVASAIATARAPTWRRAVPSGWSGSSSTTS
ncbi:MAG: hypothetical protein AAF730_12090 [Bacteroidota bacterium]